MTFAVACNVWAWQASIFISGFDPALTGRWLIHRLDSFSLGNAAPTHLPNGGGHYGAFFLSLLKSVVFQFESMIYWFWFCNAFPQNAALALTKPLRVIRCAQLLLRPVVCLFYCCLHNFPAPASSRTQAASVGLWNICCHISALLWDCLCKNPVKIPQPIEWQV